MASISNEVSKLITILKGLQTAVTQWPTSEYNLKVIADWMANGGQFTQSFDVLNLIYLVIGDQDWETAVMELISENMLNNQAILYIEKVAKQAIAVALSGLLDCSANPFINDSYIGSGTTKDGYSAKTEGEGLTFPISSIDIMGSLYTSPFSRGGKYCYYDIMSEGYSAATIDDISVDTGMSETFWQEYISHPNRWKISPSLDDITGVYPNEEGVPYTKDTYKGAIKGEYYIFYRYSSGATYTFTDGIGGDSQSQENPFSNECYLYTSAGTWIRTYVEVFQKSNRSIKYKIVGSSTVQRPYQSDETSGYTDYYIPTLGISEITGQVDRNTIWKTRDFDAWLWYVINLGHNDDKCIWDNRYDQDLEARYLRNAKAQGLSDDSKPVTTLYGIKAGDKNTNVVAYNTESFYDARTEEEVISYNSDKDDSLYKINITFEGVSGEIDWTSTTKTWENTYGTPYICLWGDEESKEATNEMQYLIKLPEYIPEDKKLSGDTEYKKWREEYEPWYDGIKEKYSGHNETYLKSGKVRKGIWALSYDDKLAEKKNGGRKYVWEELISKWDTIRQYKKVEITMSGNVYIPTYYFPNSGITEPTLLHEYPQDSDNYTLETKKCTFTVNQSRTDGENISFSSITMDFLEWKDKHDVYVKNDAKNETFLTREVAGSLFYQTKSSFYNDFQNTDIKNVKRYKKQLLKVNYYTDSDCVRLTIPPYEYYRSRKIVVPFNKFMLEWNNDYLASIKLFDIDTILAQIIDALFNKSTKISLGLTKSKILCNNIIDQVISNVISLDDTTVNDCYFSFSNSDYDTMLRKADLMRSGKYDGNTAIDVSTIYSITDEVTQGTSAGDVTTLANTMRAISGASNEDYNVPTNTYRVSSMLTELLKNLAYPFIEPLFRPKIMVVLAMNFKAVGLDISEAWNQALSILINVAQTIIIKIKDMLVEMLLAWVTAEVSKLMAQVVEKLALEQIEEYRTTLEELLKLLKLFYKRGGSVKGQIDNVKYADIEEEVSTDAGNDKC